MTTFRIIRDTIVILACLCVIVLTAEVLILEAKIANTISQIGQTVDPGPVPSETGCPFGPGQCGG